MYPREVQESLSLADSVIGVSIDEGTVTRVTETDSFLQALNSAAETGERSPEQEIPRGASMRSGQGETPPFTGFEQQRQQLQLTSANSLKEQVGSIVSELSVLRHEMNTLRLAGSQYEMQSAEVSRRMREMDTQLRADMQAQTVQFQELNKRLSEPSEQRVVQAQPELQDRDCMPKMSTVREEQFAGFQLSLDEKKQGMDRMRVFHNELVAEVQSMKDDFDAKVREMQTTFRQALGNMGQETEEKTKAAINKFADGSLKDQLSQLSAQLSKAASTRSAGVEELVFKVAAQEKAAREQLASNYKAELDDNLSTFARLRNEVANLANSDEQGSQGNVRELIAREQGSREKADGSFSDRISEFEKWTREQLAQLSKEQSARHADAKDLVSKSAAQAKAAHDDLVSSYKAELRDVSAKCRSDIGDQKMAVDELLLKQRALSSEDRSQAEYVAEGFRKRLTDLERDVKDVAADFSSFREKAASSVMLESVGQKLDSELARLSDDCNLKYSQMKTHQESLSSALEGVEQKLQDEHKKMVEAHEGDIDEINKTHAELVEVVSRFNIDHNATKSDIHSSFHDKMQGLEMRLREFVSHQLEDCQVRISGVTGSLATVDRRLREEFLAASAEESARLSEIKEYLTKSLADHSREILDLKGQLSRNVSLQKTLVDDCRSDAMKALQGSESKLWREVSVKIDESQATEHEHLTGERRDREANTTAISARIEDVDRRVRGALEQLDVVRQETGESAVSNLLSVLERKLRDEILRLEEESNSKVTDIKDQFQRGINDQAVRQMESKELIGKVSVDEKRAREECRSSLAASIEQVEMKLRREMATARDSHHSNLREIVQQETQTREKAQRALSDQLTDLERIMKEEISQVSGREVAVNEMREALLATCAKDREHLQTMLAKEQEFRTTQVENINKQLLQEKAMRETQQESLRVYLTNEKLAQDSRDKTFQKKEDHDVDIKKVWAEVRHHTHDLNVKSLTPPTQTRNVSPMLASRRIPSPQPANVWMQKSVPSQTRGLPLQPAALSQQLPSSAQQQTAPAQMATMQQEQTYESIVEAMQSRNSSVACSPGMPSNSKTSNGEPLQFQFQSWGQEATSPNPGRRRELAEVVQGGSLSAGASSPMQRIFGAPTSPAPRMRNNTLESTLTGVSTVNSTVRNNTMEFSLDGGGSELA